MRRFNFKLEKILTLREYRERETELELGRAVGVLSALELRIKNVAQEKILAVESRFSSHDFCEIRSYEFYILRLDQTRDVLLEQAALAELEVEKARAIYLEASRDRKVISKLKERQERDYRRNINLEEIKTIDDLSGGTAARKTAVGA
ncbi:MAG: flagellar export protein FliJ [Treponema sp.]|nr:flagellar export protein FliJ [Treponema sp.]